MKKLYIICGIILLGVLAVMLYQKPKQEKLNTNSVTTAENSNSTTTNSIAPLEEAAPTNTTNNNSSAANTNTTTNTAAPATKTPPIERAKERITKKPFGIHITKATSPVQPERFSGYHTGTDFEAFENEKDTSVTISAFCEGKLVYKKWVSGYGGVAIQSCTINKEGVTVLYGHLNLDTITKNVGDTVRTNDVLGNLGEGYSQQTDGERKHLHFSIHKGTGIQLKGYVQKASELQSWIDPLTIL